jgi:hypothetical protein
MFEGVLFHRGKNLSNVSALNKNSLIPANYKAIGLLCIGMTSQLKMRLSIKIFKKG